MNDVRLRITELKKKGWTLAAIADELSSHRETVYRWDAGRNYPPKAKGVIVILDALLKRKRIPKRKRYKKADA